MAEHHLEIPRTLNDNKAWRKSLWQEAQRDVSLQAAIRERCRDDILYYINGWVIQFNPNALAGQDEVGPFVMWPKQEEVIRAIVAAISDRKDLLLEKSREMGASWLCLLVMDWMSRFHRWKKFLCISRNEELVDAADPDSLFWKLDFVHRNLPKWLRGERRRKKRHIGYETHSFITGQATTEKSGVGGRCTAMFIDEFAQIREGFEINRRTANTTRCRIFNSTHKGGDTCFAALVDSAERLGSPRKLQIHWSDHPEKRRGLYCFDALTGKVEVLDKQYEYPPDFQFVMLEEPSGGAHPGLRSPWYDEMCVRMNNDRRGIAEDLDIDIQGSVSAFFDVRSLNRHRAEFACEPFWQGDVEVSEGGEFLGLAQSSDGPLKLWAFPRMNGCLEEDDYGMGGDIATGIGTTNSCLSGVRASTGEKVLEYATCRVKPEALAAIACALGHMMQNQAGAPAYFAWEHKGPGTLFGQEVMALGYRRYYLREARQLGFKPNLSLPGWEPAKDNKRVLLERYRAALDKREFINHSEWALRDCKAYRYAKNGSVEHPEDSGGDDPTGARVNHGDRTIADALGWKMVQEMAGARVKETKANQIVPYHSLAWRRAFHENEERRDWA